ncbi:ankyrin-3-like [Scylla paramamosain]|uniref:ankyrin-3-like n=1 Tax=Scylla paramamosain TaxID=85552 RepID=UPI0030829A21
MTAALNGHAHTVKALLDLRGNPLAMDGRGEAGHQQCVAALLPVSPPSPAHLEACTPLHLASYHGHVEVLEQLAGAGWPLTAMDSDGNTPMHSAAEGRCAAAVQWLVQRGCDPLVQLKDGRTPLELAVQHGRHEVESWLVKNCSGVVRRKTLRVQQVRAWRGRHEHHHNTVLSLLVEGNKAAIASIPEVYDGHTLSQDGLTPLHAAALCGAPSDAVEALLQRGVSPHVTTPDSMTPADLAQQQGQDSVIKGLQRHHCVQQYGNPKFQLHKSI